MLELLGQGVIRSLLASTLRASVVAVDPSPKAVRIVLDQSVTYTMASDPAYVHEFTAHQRVRPDAIITWHGR